MLFPSFTPDTWYPVCYITMYRQSLPLLPWHEYVADTSTNQVYQYSIAQWVFPSTSDILMFRSCLQRHMPPRMYTVQHFVLGCRIRIVSLVRGRRAGKRRTELFISLICSEHFDVVTDRLVVYSYTRTVSWCRARLACRRRQLRM